MRLTRQHTCVLVSVFLAAVLTWTMPMTFAEDEPEETVLRIGYMQRIDSLNPNVGLTDASRFFYSLVYDSLSTVDEDMETVGNLAVDWRPVPLTDPEMISSGEPYGSVWEYNLTGNAYWHDGEPLTVDDVVWTINLNADNYDVMWSYQPYAYFMDYAEAVDEDTVRIHFYNRQTTEPMPASYADLICIPILPKHKLQAYTPGFIGFTWSGVFDGEDYPIVGTGPFTATEYILDEFTEGDHLTLIKNPNYHWLADHGLSVDFDKIVMRFYDDDVAMSMALRMGDLDIAQFPPQTYLTIKDDVDDGELQDVAYYDGVKCTQYWTEIGINYNEAGPNQARLDPAVRQAMAMATDKEYIVNNYYLGLAEEGTTLISPVNEQWHYEPTAEEMYQYDLDAANAVLEAAGYEYPYGGDFRAATETSLAVENGWLEVGDPLVFEMVVRREYPEERDIADYLRQVWAGVGIDLDYRVVDEVTLATEVYQYNYDTMIWYWSSDPDPNYMLFCESGAAISGWSDNAYDNPDYNEAYLNSVAETDPVERKVYTDECQRINYLDAYYNILAYPYQTYAYRTDTFHGWGDWSAHPGRSLDAFWGAHPLLFDLIPGAAPNSAPTGVAIELPESVHEGSPAEITFAAEDVDFDDLLFEVDFGDGEVAEHESEASAEWHEITLTHVYDVAGVYSISVSVDDQTGLDGHVVSCGPEEYTVLADDVPPVTEIEIDGEVGELGWYTSSVTVNLTASDTWGEVNTTEWMFNDGSWDVFTGPFTISAEGVNTLTYRSTDTHGNIEANQTFELKIDTEAPSLVVDMDTSLTSNSATVSISWSDDGSGVVLVTASLDWALEVSTDLSDTMELSDLDDGEHTLTVRAYDEAGNVYTEMVNFNVETSVFALDGPAGPWVIVGIVAALLAAVGAASFLMYRRMKSSGE